jgi:hypothetical protein
MDIAFPSASTTKRRDLDLILGSRRDWSAGAVAGRGQHHRGVVADQSLTGLTRKRMDGHVEGRGRFKEPGKCKEGEVT